MNCEARDSLTLAAHGAVMTLLEDARPELVGTAGLAGAIVLLATTLDGLVMGDLCPSGFEALSMALGLENEGHGVRPTLVDALREIAEALTEKDAL